MNGTSIENRLTGAVSINKSTSVINMLKQCNYFKIEIIQLMYVLNLLNLLKVFLQLTPKCHPKIARRGIDYMLECSKLRFQMGFNDAVAISLR